MPRYTEITAKLAKEISFIACTECGLLVWDTEQHDKWHDVVSETVSQARNADMMTRPIGPGPNQDYLTSQIPQHLIDRAVAARKKAQENNEGR
jgi:hypothetical protein